MWNLFLPRTMRGHLASSLLNWNTATRLKTSVAAWRSRIARRFAKPPLILASLTPPISPPSFAKPETALAWKKIEDFSDFVRLCRELGMNPTRHDQDRLKIGAYCLFATDSGRVLGSYWVFSGIQWADPACLFTLNAPSEKIWAFGAQAHNGSNTSDLFARLKRFFGTTDLHIVLDSSNSEEKVAAIASGFATATDTTACLAKLPTEVELN